MLCGEELADFEDQDLLDFLLQDKFSSADLMEGDLKAMADWSLPEPDILTKNDMEDFLSSILGPFEDDTGSMQSHSPPGSDSGFSEDNQPFCGPGTWDASPSSSPRPCNASDGPRSPDLILFDHTYSLQEAEESVLESVRSETSEGDVFIDLESWVSDVAEDVDSSSPVTGCSEDFTPTDDIDLMEEDFSTIDDVMPTYTSQLEFGALVLTEEEKRLLGKEGVTLPSNLPLTKSEERVLKKVRRKIRNKQSAQESRRKKKDYVGGLETRVAACTVQNQELQKKVHLLQKQNISLMQQLRNLQSLVKQTTTKTTTSSTCVMMLLLSFCLILFPSFYPFGPRGHQQEIRGVLSRQLREIRSDVSVPQGKVYSVLSEGEMYLESEPAELKADLLKSILSAGSNDTPEVENLSKAESRSSINSNSSSDIDSGGKADQAPSRPAEEATRGALDAHIPVVTTPKVKEDWPDRTTSVVIAPRHSDEM